MNFSLHFKVQLSLVGSKFEFKSKAAPMYFWSVSFVYQLSGQFIIFLVDQKNEKLTGQLVYQRDWPKVHGRRLSVTPKGLNLNSRKYLHKFCSTSGILFLGGVCFCPQQYMCLFSLLQILFWKWSIISVFLTGFFSFGIVLSIASLLQVHESTGKQSQLSERKNQMVIVFCISQKEYFLFIRCSVLMIVIA